MTDINNVIDQIVEERTLSLEAADAIKGLRDENAELRDHVAALEERVNAFVEVESKLKDECRRKNSMLEGYIRRENELIDREKNALRLEIENEFLKARAAELKEIINNLTRNTMVRQRVFGTESLVMPPYESGGMTMGPVVSQQPYDSTTESEEV